MLKLENKVAIITGGAAGIGKATAIEFINQGAKVMLVDIAEEKLIKTTNEIDSEYVAYCVADVSKSKDTKEYIEHTLKIFGGIDILFSNAGIEGIVRPIISYPEDVFDQVISVNLKGVWLSLQYAIPKMNDGGTIIITSSIAGLKGFEGLGAYVASKHALIGIMRTAAIEYAPRNIRVNTIHPGPVETQMMRRIEKNIAPEEVNEAKKGFEAIVPFGRYATAKEISDLALFLASDDSKYITGGTFVVDGGATIA